MNRPFFLYEQGIQTMPNKGASIEFLECSNYIGGMHA
jgi:hypothetical protein